MVGMSAWLSGAAMGAVYILTLVHTGQLATPTTWASIAVGFVMGIVMGGIALGIAIREQK